MITARIANIEHGGKIDMYKKEYPEFQAALFGISQKDTHPMWRHLDKLLI